MASILLLHSLSVREVGRVNDHLYYTSNPLASLLGVCSFRRRGLPCSRPARNPSDLTPHLTRIHLNTDALRTV
ncbi:hypothetical protein [Phormidesmis priestleyi]